MAKKKRKGGKSITQTAFKWLRVGALVAPAVHEVLSYPGDPNVINTVMEMYTGYNPKDGTFDVQRLARGWGGYLMASLATYGIPKLTGIIRRL